MKELPQSTEKTSYKTKPSINIDWIYTKDKELYENDNISDGLTSEKSIVKSLLGAFFLLVNNPRVRTAFYIGVPILISVLISVFIQLEHWRFMVISVIVYILIVLLMAWKEERDKTSLKTQLQIEQSKNIAMERQKSQLNHYKISLINLKQLIRKLSENIQIDSTDVEISHNLKELCQASCESIYHSLFELKTQRAYEVTFVSCSEQKKCATLISWKNEQGKSPTILNRVQKQKSVGRNKNTYFFTKLALATQHQDVIFCTNEEIVCSFYFRNGNNDRDKYRQYAAVPVICDSQCIGYFQIVTFLEYGLGENKEDIEHLLEISVRPITELICISRKLLS